MGKIDKSILGITGEYCVASELGRRNIYSQLTFGNRKKTDILVESKKEYLSIEVKSKQGPSWPNCKGIFGDNSVIIFVDFQNKSELQRPDFYILTAKDWIELLNDLLNKDIQSGKVKIDDQNVPIWSNQVKKDAKPYKGMDIKPRDIEKHKEQWDKITKRIM